MITDIFEELRKNGGRSTVKKLMKYLPEINALKEDGIKNKDIMSVLNKNGFNFLSEASFRTTLHRAKKLTNKAKHKEEVINNGAKVADPDQVTEPDQVIKPTKPIKLSTFKELIHKNKLSKESALSFPKFLDKIISDKDFEKKSVNQLAREYASYSTANAIANGERLPITPIHEVEYKYRKEFKLFFGIKIDE